MATVYFNNGRQGNGLYLWASSWVAGTIQIPDEARSMLIRSTAEVNIRNMTTGIVTGVDRPHSPSRTGILVEYESIATMLTGLKRKLSRITISGHADRNVPEFFRVVKLAFDYADEVSIEGMDHPNLSLLNFCGIFHSCLLMRQGPRTVSQLKTVELHMCKVSF